MRNMSNGYGLADLERRLGVPAYSADNVSLHQGDCLTLMQSLPDASIPLTITSPPYNIGKEYEAVMPTDAYLAWCEQWLNEIYRITTPTGALWLNLGYFEVPNRAKAIPIAYALWNRIPFYIVQEVVWNYGAGVAGKKFFSPRNEKFLWCVKNPTEYVFNLDSVRDTNVKYPNQKKNGKLKCNVLGKNPTDVWQFPKVTSGTNRASKERTDHPAQFPLALIDRIIKASSNEGDIVLDPFAGSGTTAVATVLNNRIALGFEIRPDYARLAARRIAHSQATFAARQAQLHLAFRE